MIVPEVWLLPLTARLARRFSETAARRLRFVCLQYPMLFCLLGSLSENADRLVRLVSLQYTSRRVLAGSLSEKRRPTRSTRFFSIKQIFQNGEILNLTSRTSRVMFFARASGQNAATRILQGNESNEPAGVFR